MGAGLYPYQNSIESQAKQYQSLSVDKRYQMRSRQQFQNAAPYDSRTPDKTPYAP